MYNDLEWASQDEWDAYAWFGFAIAEAQTVERQLLLIAVALTNQREDSWFDLYDKLERWTLGRLCAHIEPFGALPNDVLELLKRAVTARNTLAHVFFVPRMGAERPPTMAKKELQKTASLFSYLSTRLESVIWPLVENHDVNVTPLSEKPVGS
jgi:hypothetical protein